MFTFYVIIINMEKFLVSIENLDHYARGIAHLDGKIFFIENALVGENVLACVDKSKKNFLEGHSTDIKKSSIERVEPICPYYFLCGGCSTMHMNYESSLRFKENKVKEVLKKFCNYDNVKSIIPTKGLYYRNKVTFQVNGELGFYKNKTYDLVEIDKCLIADKRINFVIEKLKKLDLTLIDKIVVRTTKNEMMLILYTKKVIKLNINDFNEFDTIICIADTKYILKGKGYIIDEINNLKYIISPTSFYQVNTEGMINLYDKVLEYCDLKGNENVLDLYCGTGTIGIYLSKYAKKVFGIEINKEAISDAFKNKEINNLNNIEFKSGDVKDVLKQNKFIPDIVIVDPPRAGLDKSVIEKIILLKPKKIIYVSCDVVTLARDLNLFKENYDIAEVTPVDMFAETYHVECVCVLNLI